VQVRGRGRGNRAGPEARANEVKMLMKVGARGYAKAYYGRGQGKARVEKRVEEYVEVGRKGGVREAKMKNQAHQKQGRPERV